VSLGRGGEGRQPLPIKLKRLWLRLCLGFKILLFQVPIAVLLVDVCAGLSSANKPAAAPRWGCAGARSEAGLARRARRVPHDFGKKWVRSKCER